MHNIQGPAKRRKSSDISIGFGFGIIGGNWGPGSCEAKLHETNTEQYMYIVYIYIYMHVLCVCVGVCPKAPSSQYQSVLHVSQVLFRSSLS